MHLEEEGIMSRGRQEIVRQAEVSFALAEQIAPRSTEARVRADWMAVEAFCGFKEASSDG